MSIGTATSITISIGTDTSVVISIGTDTSITIITNSIVSTSECYTFIWECVMNRVHLFEHVFTIEVIWVW